MTSFWSAVSSATTWRRTAHLSSASIPLTEFDRQNDVLRISVAPPAGPSECILDAEEIFIFRDVASGRPIGFEVPHYSTYWRKHIDQLVAHLETYLDPPARNLKSALFADYQSISPGSLSSQQQTGM